MAGLCPGHPTSFLSEHCEDVGARHKGPAMTTEHQLDNRLYIHKSRYMESEQAILVLAALAQSTRLDVFRLLVKHEPDGLAAGDIAKALAAPQNTMSSHLAILSRAGLVSAQRFGRSIVYRAELARFQQVVLFMLRDCCDGRPEICAPVIESLTPCCLPKPKRKAQGRTQGKAQGKAYV